MDCVIPGNNMKVINRALLALAKISTELYIECTPDNFSLISMNMNKTVYTKFKFFPLFFLSYEVKEVSEEHGVTCKMYVKSLLGIFKQKMEKKIETCRMILKEDGSKMDVRVSYKDNITVLHKLGLIDQDYLTVCYSIEDMKNLMSGNGSFFVKVLSNFQQGDLNMSFQASRDKIVFWNYDIGTDTVYNSIRSQLCLASTEFGDYKIGEETSLVMSLKPLRAATSFAEHFNLNLEIHFKSGGWPVIVVIKSSTFNVTYVLSSINPDGSNPSTAATNVAEENRKAAEEDANNLTAQDREALENMDWDDNLDEFGAGKSAGTNKFSTENNVDEQERLDFADDAQKQKLQLVFGRCFEPTMNASMFKANEVLVPNSDSEDDSCE